MSTAKLKILQETFENSFDIDKFRTFTREFFNEPEMFPHRKRVGIWKEYADHIASYEEIAKYTDREGNNLIVLAVEIKKEKSVERARSLQRNFISKLLEMNNYEAAIVAFYSPNEDNWRLSFVRLDYTFNEKGLTLDLTPAKRYSYLVGKGEPNHTAQSQLLPIFEDDKHNPTLDEIETAFSVEKVTKDFFEQYKEKYIQLKEYLEQDQAFVKEAEKLGLQVQQFSEQFAKKLMGQLAFLYFLQKKGWLGVRIMPEDRTLTEVEFIEIYQRQDEPHRAVLEKVFIKTSDGRRKLSSREMFNISDQEAELLSDCFIGTKYDMPWGSGNKQFIRTLFNFCMENTNKNFFVHFLQPLFYEALNKKRKNHYFKKFNCKIPFLNGGLFEPLEGYHWKDVDFNIPNEIFSNANQKNREADGILDIFDRYNFTINEDEPLEKEVAVDPEMLGKIFENLLDVKDRKSKGAFYTPREIVHYMCQESLTNYLVNEVGVPYEDMKEFILYGELIRDADKRRDVGYGKDFTIKQTIFDNIVKIDQALKNIKVADPAVGSGAFPLGMLSEIVRIRNNITEYLVWKDKEGALGRRYGEEIIRKKRSPYRLKWETIKNSIFAVDIEPSAVDIAKLRLWLSVIVDQEINDETPEPHPLPNLDCNIMVGNSLIDEYEGIKLFDEKILVKKKNKVKENSENYNTIVQLSLLIDNTDEMLNEMFQLQDRYFDEEDEQRKKEIKNKIDRIRDDLIEYKLQLDGNEEGLKKYKELQKNKQRPYFLWHLEFAKVFQEKGGFDIVIGNPPYGAKISDEDKVVIKKWLKDTKNMNSAALFIDYSKNSLLNNRGILSFIVPKSLLYSEKWFSLVEALLKNTNVLVDVEKAFEKVKLEQVLFVYNAAFEYETYTAKKFLDKKFIRSTIINNSLVKKFSAWVCDVSKEELDIIRNLKVDIKYMKEISVTKRGVGLQKFLQEDGDYPVIGGKNIVRFGINGVKGFIPKDKIDSHKKKLEFMQQPKIMSQDLIAHIQNPTPHIKITSCFDPTGEVLCLDTVQNTVIIDDNYDYNYILALLNSNFVSWYTYKFIYCSAIRTMHFDNNYIGRIIIPVLTKDEQKPLIDIVNDIREIYKSTLNNLDNEYTKKVNELLFELNNMVYRIYGLKNKEINIIENK
ncbi:Eco57I restriction-modification methylase domain-containing protein [Anoxybacillus sp. ST70]|uniref:Eco57I restriction-modification methylase domain-containing protein n=1 Tax=Anoxybacillus TaxID=150247 RepID=UPI001C6FC111|nr:TaqI-like C-terminal specificity domain-containing protein [Anoxybacillus sp. ST70]MBW9216938.1 Eco57I restriction-modification methylase domain-containing protein [Anoxybacillus sp. ST70]